MSYKNLATRILEAENFVDAGLKSVEQDAKPSMCVGSAYIRDCADSDIDVLVLVPGPTYVIPEGWDEGGSGDDTVTQWASYKQDVPGIGVINMLVVTDPTYYDKWVAAAEVCRYLHLTGVTLTKEAVKAVHNLVMDDAIADHQATLVPSCT